jgi:hypothetical protein
MNKEIQETIAGVLRWMKYGKLIIEVHDGMITKITREETTRAAIYKRNPEIVT